MMAVIYNHWIRNVKALRLNGLCVGSRFCVCVSAGGGLRVSAAAAAERVTRGGRGPARA